jgi:hypothetical protein
MRQVLLTLLLTASATMVNAQCHCVKLRLAIDDNRMYRYRYYVVGSQDTTTAEQLSPTDQLRDRRTGHATSAESYGVYDPATGQTVRHRYDDRPYLLLPLSHLHQRAFDATTVRVEVTDQAAPQRKMVLTFHHWGFDEEYNLLFDFAPGHRYRLDLRALSWEWSRTKRPVLAGFRQTTVAGGGSLQWVKLQHQ